MQVNRSGVTNFLAKAADFRSYSDAQALIEWLNCKGQNLSRRQKRVVRAINVLREINRCAAGARPWQGLSSELSAIVKPLNHLRWRLMKNETGRWYLDQTYSGDADYGLFLVARLSGHGLDWVRQCPRCQKWFIGLKRTSLFCSEECRVTAWSERRKTPEGRQARKLYMRKHRKILADRGRAPKRRRGSYLRQSN